MDFQGAVLQETNGGNKQPPNLHGSAQRKFTPHSRRIRRSARQSFSSEEQGQDPGPCSQGSAVLLWVPCIQSADRKRVQMAKTATRDRPGVCPSPARILLAKASLRASRNTRP